jgi:lipopolysaccharide export system permease protein
MPNSIDRYIFRTTFGAFLMILLSLTGIIWITHALREIDLVTNQGQTILVFLGITGLLIPILAQVIAPIAFVIAVVYAIDKLNGDAELVVMNAAGMSPWRLFRPFLAVAITVALLVGFISAYLSPSLQRELRDRATRVRTDLVTNIVQPGRFLTVEGGLTFHIRERRSNGELSGILIDDRRNPDARSTFLAEQGSIVKKDGGTFLLLENGSIQRLEKARGGEPRIVMFDRYAFDLSRFTNDAPVHVTHRPARERYLWELFAPPAGDPLVKAQPGHFRADLHDRLLAPIYPLAFVVIAFAAIGGPRTTRQSRGFAVALAIGGVAVLRLIGFACIVLSIQTPTALAVLYGSVIFTCTLGALAIRRGVTIEPPASLTNFLSSISERVVRQAAT